MSKLNDVVIVSAKRTPIGSFQGVFSNFSAHKLGALVIKSLIEETKIDKTAVDEVIMGECTLCRPGTSPCPPSCFRFWLTKFS